MIVVCCECDELIKPSNEDKVSLVFPPFGVFCCVACAEKFLDEYEAENKGCVGGD
jgi:hypothetical protein